MSRSIQSLGSVVSITIHDAPRPAYFNGAFAIVEQIHSLMSLYIADSDLIRLRDSAGQSTVQVHAYTSALLDRALEIAEDSGYLFNPLVEPLVSLWNIGIGGSEIPSAERIQALLPLLSPENLERRLSASGADEVYLNTTGMGIDLGGIGKGFAADLVVDFLKAQGVEQAILDFGGNIAVIGRKNAEQKWNIGIQDPLGERGSFVGSIPAEDISLVSSGVYERYFIAEGQRYHHLLNPFTGYPENNELLAVTVMSESSTTADGYATALFLLGLSEGMRTTEANAEIEALFITRDMHIHLSSGFESFTLLSENYEVLYSAHHHDHEDQHNENE